MQVGAGRGEVRVPQLALDQRQRDALMQQLDSVRMAELVGREAPAPASSATWCSCSLAAPADQACPRVGPAITQNNGPTGSVARSDSHGPSADHPHASIPTWRRRSFLPCLTRIDPRRSSRSVDSMVTSSFSLSPASLASRGFTSADGRGRRGRGAGSCASTSCASGVLGSRPRVGGSWGRRCARRAAVPRTGARKERAGSFSPGGG